MPRSELYYLDQESADKIKKMVERLASEKDKLNPEALLKEVTELLPILRTDVTTVRRRVEGFHYTTEVLWKTALDMKIGERAEIVKRAKLKPLSHYHYLTGSREPVGNVLTRADYLNDPSTALVKLRDDILGIASVF